MSKHDTKGIYGSRVAGAMLTEPQVRAIRRDLIAGRPPKEVAAVYQLGIETIRRIGRRESWAWVEDFAPPPDITVSITEDEKGQAAASLARLQELLKKQ